ncbi:hypothetical protein ABIA33_006364 [Streptacidiphilus sp. MAP12-16]
MIIRFAIWDQITDTTGLPPQPEPDTTTGGQTRPEPDPHPRSLTQPDNT